MFDNFYFSSMIYRKQKSYYTFHLKKRYKKALIFFLEKKMVLSVFLIIAEVIAIKYDSREMLES